MKKVLVFTSLFGYPFFGGAEASIFEFYKSLNDLNAKKLICTLDKLHSNRNNFNELENTNVKRFASILPHPVLHRKKINLFIKIVSHALNLSIGFRPLSVLWQFWKFKPDLVITHNLAGWGYLPWIMCRLFDVPVVHDNHDFYLVCSKTTKWKYSQGLCVNTCLKCVPREQSSRLFWRGGTMIFNSHFLKVEIKEILESKFLTQLEVIYPPVMIQKTKNENYRPEFDFVFVGRLEESKGIREFLEVTALKNYKIAVGGTGNLMNELVKKYPKVEFLGQIDSIKVMFKSKVLVVPSLLHETYGRVALEGIAVGLPVLVSRRGGLAEFKERPGSALIPFEPLDKEEFQKKLEEALAIGRNNQSIGDDWTYSHHQLQLQRFKEIIVASMNSKGILEKH